LQGSLCWDRARGSSANPVTPILCPGTPVASPRRPSELLTERRVEHLQREGPPAIIRDCWRPHPWGFLRAGGSTSTQATSGPGAGPIVRPAKAPPVSARPRAWAAQATQVVSHGRHHHNRLSVVSQPWSNGLNARAGSPQNRHSGPPPAGLDPPRGAGGGGVHPLQPGRAVHPRAPRSFGAEQRLELVFDRSVSNTCSTGSTLIHGGPGPTRSGRSSTPRPWHIPTRTGAISSAALHHERCTDRGRSAVPGDTWPTCPLSRDQPCLHDQVDLDTLTAELLAVIHQTVEPRRLALAAAAGRPARTGSLGPTARTGMVALRSACFLTPSAAGCLTRLTDHRDRRQGGGVGGAAMPGRSSRSAGRRTILGAAHKPGSASNAPA
jgi:hypothetical protein